MRMPTGMMPWAALAPAMLWAAPALAVEGTVREQGTGNPIPDATIQVIGEPSDAAPSGATDRATTDSRGRFTLDAPPGTLIRVLAPGWLPAEMRVPAEGPLNVWMKVAHGDSADGKIINEIVVESDRDAPSQSEQHLDRERVLKTPGTFEDPVRLVQSLPGVTVTPEYSKAAGDIAVRGAAPGENRFFLDGIELPYLYHYNQYASVFHTRLLDELTLIPSTGPAQWGDVTGAVVDTRSAWEQPARPRGSANLNLVMGGAEVAVPLSDRWSVRLSGRRSYLDLAEKDNPWYTAFPTFWDYFSRLEYHPDRQQSLGFLAFGAGDKYTRLAIDPSLLDSFEQTQNAAFAWDHQFHIFAFQHHLLLSPAVDPISLDGSLSWTSHLRRGSLATAEEQLNSGILALREDLLWVASEQLTVATGIDARMERLAVLSDTDRAWPGLEEETALLAEGIAADETLLRLRTGLYLETRWTAGPVRLIPSVRTDIDGLRLAATGAQAASVDPRLALRWQGPSTRLRLAGGQYSALPSTETLAAAHLLGAPGALPATRSLQIAAGADQVVAERLEFSLDGYYKRLSNLSDLDPYGTLHTGLDGQVIGAEFTSRYRLRDLFFSAISLSLSRATRADADGTLRIYDYDQPFALNAVASYSFAPTWNVGLRYRLASGLPYTPAVDGVYDAVSDSYDPVYGDANSMRLPMYQKFDLHVEKRFDQRWWNLTLYLEAWYVPELNNVMYVVYRYDYDEQAAVHGPGFVPLVGVRGEF